MNPYLLISIPFVTALIGWFTNWIAIRMLFRPRQPIGFLGINVQGLIPRRQKDLAVRTAEIIESEILQKHAIRQAILKLDLEPHMQQLIQTMIERKLKSKLETIPFLGNFINDQTIEMVKQIALESISEELPSMIENVANDLESKIDIKKMVEERMNDLDLEALEAIVQKVASKEFRVIENLGALLGFLVGLMQVLLLTFL
jgi:uncharacterized membrane protein YheB (UPF0754 family)